MTASQQEPCEHGVRWPHECKDCIYATAPAAASQEPLTAQQPDALIERHCGGTELSDGEYRAMVLFAASVERAHGIGTDRPYAETAREAAEVLTEDYLA